MSSQCALSGLLIGLVVSVAPSAGAAPQIDRVATDLIRSATTEPRFLTPWVESLPDDAAVPSPRDVLGYTIGAPGELTQVEEIYGYFNALDETSDRIRVFSLGRSYEGREMIVAAVADEAVLQDLERYRGYLEALSDPRQTDAANAAQLVADARPIYWITGGLHSPELGPPEMLMELAYRLVVEEGAPFEDIRRHVIVLITPVLEADGRARQVDWYRTHLEGKHDYNNLPPRSSPFWGHYIYHDNNRDGISISQPLTRNYVQGVYHWKPTISLDLHESVPLVYVAGGTGPYNADVSPITIGEWQALSSYEISRMNGFGLPGVWTWGYYTGWYPGYMLWATNNHNALGRFYETFGNGSAETMDRDLKEVEFAGKKVTTRQWYRAAPPPRKLTWSMRNNINYMESTALASLEMVAHNGELFLGNYYRKGVEALKEGREKPPYAFLIPRVQRDSEGLDYLIGVLRRHGIEMRVAERKARYGDLEVRRGDLLVLMDQPYGPLARDLLSVQEFPDKVEVPPYDDVSWTLGLMMSVEVKPIPDKAVLAGESRLLGGREPYVVRSRLPRRGRYWAIANHAQRELGPVRFALGEIPVQVAEEEFRASGESFPAGSLIIDLEGQERDRIAGILERSYLPVRALSRMPKVPVHEADLPRVAVFQTWTSTQNAGWVRFSFDDAAVPYTLIGQDRVKQGGLSEAFDVIVVPNMSPRTDVAEIIGGIDRKWSPLAYQTTPGSPNLGHILSSPDITGGVGFAGMAAFEAFIREGGTLVALGSGGVIPVESGMAHDVQLKRPGGLNTPGSILTARVTDPASPLTYGYDEITYLFRGNGPIYGVKDYNRPLAVLQFGTRDWDAEDSGGKPEKADGDANKPPLVRSGGIVSGKDKIDGEPALVCTALGQGRVVLFSWDPMHRDVNHHDQAFLYNALLNWNDLPDRSRHAEETIAAGRESD